MPPVALCQAQNAEDGFRWSSGFVPVGQTITHRAFAFDAELVLPKCAAARSDSAAIWLRVDWLGEATASSSQTPASASPVG